MTVKSAEAYYESQRGTIRYMRDCVGSFYEGISKGEKRRILRLCMDGYIVTPIRIERALPIIVDNRVRKGRPYSMSENDWYDLASISTVYCWGVKVPESAEIIAAAMCVMVHPTVLYVQAWGDVPGVEKLSPVLLLAYSIFLFCQSKGIRQMDIGTADSAGLIAFKERLGFKPVIHA